MKKTCARSSDDDCWRNRHRAFDFEVVHAASKGSVLPGLTVARSLLAAFCFVSSQAAEFRLSPVSLDSSGRATIQLTADPGPVYTIEKSTNLTTWLPMVSGLLSNGHLDLLDPNVPGLATAFYRGRAENATNSSPAVQATLDPFRSALALVTPESGGSCEVTNDAGVRITFTVGPSNVLEAVPVIMTLVTNITGLPETEAPPVAVQFEPPGYEFLGSGTLEILFPTELPVLAMSSFAFGSDGTDLHFLPDIVETHRVVIDVTHFSAAGTAPFSGTGRRQMQNRTVKAPGKAAEHAVGSTLAKDRQATREAAPNLTTPEEWVALAEKVWREFYQPRLAGAKEDCSEARRLAGGLSFIERSLTEKTGTNQSHYSEQLRADGIAAAWICNCVREGQDACRRGAFEEAEQSFVRAEGIRSQLGVGMDQLTGCLPEPSPPNLKRLMDWEPCNVLWNGSLVFAVVRNSTWEERTFFGDLFGTLESKEIFTFSGHVVSSTFSAQTGEFELNFHGKTTGSRAYEFHEWHDRYCTHQQYSSSHGGLSASSPLTARVTLQLRGTNLAPFWIDIPPPELAVTETYLDFYENNPFPGGKCDNPPERRETTNEVRSIGAQFYYSVSDGASQFVTQETIFTQANIDGVKATGKHTYSHPGSSATPADVHAISVSLDLH